LQTATRSPYSTETGNNTKSVLLASMHRRRLSPTVSARSTDLAFGKDAKADCYARLDRWGRDICNVYVDGKDVGLAQLDAGLAWWFRKYAHEQYPKARIDYEAAEDRAAADRVGLWQDANPVPPWEWRRGH
jgi:endonuclease YncB( thermonuclease family)